MRCAELRLPVRISGPPLQHAIEPASGFLRGALRHQRAGKTGLMRPKCRLGEREVNEVALGKAAAATMRNVTHARQPFDAAPVITVSEGEQRLTERQHERIVRIRRRGAVRLGARQNAEDALRRRMRPAAASAIIACAT